MSCPSKLVHLMPSMCATSWIRSRGACRQMKHNSLCPLVVLVVVLLLLLLRTACLENIVPTGWSTLALRLAFLQMSACPGWLEHGCSDRVVWRTGRSEKVVLKRLLGKSCLGRVVFEGGSQRADWVHGCLNFTVASRQLLAKGCLRRGASQGFAVFRIRERVACGGLLVHGCVAGAVWRGGCLERLSWRGPLGKGCLQKVVCKGCSHRLSGHGCLEDVAWRSGCLEMSAWGRAGDEGLCREGWFEHGPRLHDSADGCL